MDVVELWAVNVDTVARTLYIQFGGTSTSDQVGPITLGANRGPILVLPPTPLQNGLLVRAYADSASVVNITGRVGRYTDTA